MQFNEKVLEVLGNFATINQSIVFKPGDVLTTMSPMKTMVATAKPGVLITSEFGIYNLGQFLSVLSDYETAPTLELLNKGFLRVQDVDEHYDLPLCDPSLVITPPEKKLSLPSVDVEFKIEAAIIKRVMKASQKISVPQVAFTGDGTDMFFEGLDVKNSGAGHYRRKVGTTDQTFRMIFETDNLKMLERDYTVQISSKGLSYFEAEDVNYYVAVEQTSTYES